MIYKGMKDSFWRSIIETRESNRKSIKPNKSNGKKKKWLSQSPKQACSKLSKMMEMEMGTGMNTIQT